jgi:hypothetical protein
MLYTHGKKGYRMNEYYLEKHISNKSYLHAFLLTPCSRVLLEKLIGSQLVKKFPTFYGT